MPVRLQVAEVGVSPVHIHIIQTRVLQEALEKLALGGAPLAKIEGAADFGPYALPPLAHGRQPHPVIPVRPGPQAPAPPATQMSTTPHIL